MQALTVKVLPASASLARHLRGMGRGVHGQQPGRLMLYFQLLPAGLPPCIGMHAQQPQQQRRHAQQQQGEQQGRLPYL